MPGPQGASWSRAGPGASARTAGQADRTGSQVAQEAGEREVEPPRRRHPRLAPAVYSVAVIVRNLIDFDHALDSV